MLKEMIESIINENTDRARVEFHSFLKTKLSESTDEPSDLNVLNDLDQTIMYSNNSQAEIAWDEITSNDYLHDEAHQTWDTVPTVDLPRAISDAREIIKKFNI